MRQPLLAAVLALGTCLAAASPIKQPATPVPPAARPRSPIHTVYASSQMAPECKVAVALAVGQILATGKHLDLLYVPEVVGDKLEVHRVFALEPIAGEVSIRVDFLKGSNENEQTFAWVLPDGMPVRAEIRLADCSPEVALHALAHVTGTVDRIDYERVLHAKRAQWWLDPVERRYGD